MHHSYEFFTQTVTGNLIL